MNLKLNKDWSITFTNKDYVKTFTNRQVQITVNVLAIIILLINFMVQF